MGWEYLAIVPILLGAIAQRVTGLGFALVAAPVFVLLFGADRGVLLVNVVGALAAGTGVVLDGRHVEWRRIALLVPGALVGIGLGVALFRALDPAVLEIVVGGVLLLGLLALTLVRRRSIEARPALTVATGVGAGLGGALAGLPGPPVAIYAGATGWRGRTMSASLQVLFLVTAASAALTKLLSGVATPPAQPAPFWVALTAALAAGLTIGHLATRRIPASWAWRFVVVIATAGALATIIRGIVDLATR